MQRFILSLILICLCWRVPAHGSESQPLPKSRPAISKACASWLLSEFNHPPDDEERGLVTTQIGLSLNSLLAANPRGIFPWATDEKGYAEWYNPPLRGVLEFKDLHISQSDLKFIRRNLYGPKYLVTRNQAFTQVMIECQKMRRVSKTHLIEQPTWISDLFVKAYTELFHAGYARSIEVWELEDGKPTRLVAGLYGTFIDHVFAGESMFHTDNDAAKLGMYTLIQDLIQQGHTFIDTQQALGLPLKWGAHEIPRDRFLTMLAEAQAEKRPYPMDLPPVTFPQKP